MKSQHQFSQVPRADIARSSFNLSHGLKTTFDADFLIPILGPIDIIPGDTFSVKASHFCRLATPLYPIMDNMYLETQFFFCPYRILWSNFEKFHGSQEDPGDSIAKTIPLISSSAATYTARGKLWDYFGLPIDLIPNDVDVSALPYRAYHEIYDAWYRDENLQDSVAALIGDGPDALTVNNGELLKRGKRFDYFTSCLPAPQKGTAVSMPLGTSAEIHAGGSVTDEISIYADTLSAYRDLLPVTSDSVVIGAAEDTGAARLYADLSTALAPTINDIRLAFQTQRLLERDARSGTRYVEALKAHWGVTSPDHRLQRPEYLGGGSSRINVTPVQQQSAQTSPVANDKLGELAGFGTVSGTHSFSKSFVEHGLVLGLCSVRGDITYSQGIDRYWTKSTRYDFFYPVLQGIGEQSVLNKEIWVTGIGTPATDDLVFGYQERYGEYRRLNSKLSGLMRPDASATLAAWHLSEDFATLPALGDTFIKSNLGVPLDRAIAIPTEPHFICDFYFDIKAARPMTTFGVPGGIDRF